MKYDEMNSNGQQLHRYQQYLSYHSTH